MKRLSPHEANRSLTANVLTTGVPSGPAQEYLYRANLTERFDTDPAGTIAILYDGLGQQDEPDRVFALSELSFTYAERGGGQPYYLASAAYAWAFLFPERPEWRPGEYDPRVRVAMDLYNRGITAGLASGKGDGVDLSARAVALPYGSLRIDVDPSGFTFGGYQLANFVSLADFDVRGLRNRYLQTINDLKEQPSFYNTLTANCTTNVLVHTKVNPGSLAYSWKILLSGYAPQYAYENGRSNSTLPFEELRRRGHINAAARAANDAPDFSQRIRTDVPQGR